MDNTLDNLLDTYLFETNSLLEQLDELLINAEKNADFTSDDVNEIFRIMHTIKGSSAMLEFSSLMTIAHHIEDVFFFIRENGISSLSSSHKSELFNLMFKSTDKLREEVRKVEKNEPLSTNIDSIIQEINSFLDKISKDGGGKKASAAPQAAAPAPSPAVQSRNGASLPPDPGICFLRVFFDEGCGMENARAFMLVNAVRDICGEGNFHFSPADISTDPSTAGQIIDSGFMMYFRDAEDRENAVHAVTGAGSVRTYQAFDRPQSSSIPAPAPQALPAEQKASAPEPPEQKTTANAKPAAPSPSSQSSSDAGAHHRESLISVNLSKLDQLAAVVGEIVITESMVTSSPDLKGLKLDAFTKSARQLRKLTDELQDVSMSLRMVPVSGTFQKMHRIVRDMCKKLGKQVKLTLVGEDTEVDKTIVDSISDPIMHIVRNSMDHGIEETPQDRIDAGKDPVGEIILSARHTGSEVIIEIRDDGQGVNYDAVLNKAIRNGIALPDVEYSHRDILNFLMAPGFSTNTEVTEYSGRGVGMDVVKRNVEDVGGTVVITSDPGRGMTTTLKIPLTMAIMDGMEVSVGSSIFTIPIQNIRQSFKVNDSDLIHDASGGELFKCMGSFYPVIRMRDRYQLEGGCSQISDGILIWLESGELSYCLFVDELLGEQQVVVKPLPSYLNRFNIKASGIAGCTILGDGNISIILDVSNLFASA